MANGSSSDRSAGLLLMGAASLALLLANSPLADSYQHALHAQLGPLTLHYWIADSLMAVFFLLVGLEVKREWYDGQLATADARRLPVIAALGGMVVPAAVFVAIVGFESSLMRGWAIPAATDIAFALGVLALIGKRAPASIKLLLVTIAIIDDIGAVIIIAVFYTADLNLVALVASAALVIGMFALNRIGVKQLWPYILGFLLLWAAVFQSGIHATIAGVLAALTIPLGIGERHSPLKRLEHKIHPAVMFGIVPVFGLASAGVTIGSVESVLAPLPLAVALGLFIGKQTGVFGAIWIADRTGFALKPVHLSWGHIYGVAVLCGIGFTMSLFVGELAFANPGLIDNAKIGTLLGSALSIITGCLVLRMLPQRRDDDYGRVEADELFGEKFDEEPCLDEPSH